MISVSNDYLNQINNNSLSPKAKIIVDGVEYLGNVIKDTPKTKHSATKPFGSFPAKTLSFSIYNLNNNINFENKEIEVYKGLVINGIVEYVKQGIFIPTAENISTNITERTVSFSDVQDRTQLLMDKYESNLEWSNGETHSGLEIIQEICTKKNITLKTTNFAFANYQFKQPNFSETITNRAVIAAMGEIGGETVIFNNNGELEIKSQNNTNHVIQRKRYEKLSYEKEITFNTVILGREGTNNDIVYPSEIETTRVEAKILDNPFVDLYREEMIEEVARHIIGFSYIPFNIENIVDGYIYELNDTVEVIDKNNNTFEATMLSIEGNSRIKSNLSAPQLEETKTNYSLAGSNKESISQVKLDVDHINQEVTALAEKVEIVSETIDNVGSLTLENAFNGTLHQLSIKGEMSLLFPTEENTYGYSLVPHDSLVPSNSLTPSSPIPYGNEVLYPSSNLYTKSNVLLVDDIEYKLDIDFLNYISKKTCDEFVYEDGKCKIIRRVGVNSQGQKYKLAEEVIELRNNIDIQVKSNSVIKMKTFDDLLYSSTYLIQNEYTDTFVPSIDLISRINLAPGNATIQANKIKLEGYTTINENFGVDLEGNMWAKNGSFSGNIYLENGGKVLGGEGLMSVLRFNTTEAEGGHGWDIVGFELKTDGAYQDDYIDWQYFNTYLSYYIPNNFTITEAYLILNTTPIQCAIDSDTIVTGTCKQLKVYSIEGQSGFDVYYYWNGYAGIGQYDNPGGQEIENIFGSSSYTPTISLVGEVEQKISKDIKEYLTVGQASTLCIKTNISKPPFTDPPTTNQIRQAVENSGAVKAELYVYGYMSYERKESD